MFENNGEELKKALLNIELQIHDLELEKEGHFVRLYFDTSDVEESITGISRFYHLEKFQEKLFFDHEETLVHGLATSGDLGEVHLLPPHKAELFNRLKYLKDIHQTDRTVSQFLHHTKFDKYDWESIYNDENKRDPKAFKEITNKIQPDDAENFFKTVQNLSPWYDRMKESIDEKRLIIYSVNAFGENDEIGFDSILDEPYFDQLKEIFNFLRNDERKTINNTTDAFCLSMLIEKIKLFTTNKDKQKMEVPRFFASSDNLKKFLYYEKIDISNKKIRQYIENIRKEFIYAETSQKDFPISIIRDERYFIFKAILNNEKFSTKDERISESLKKLNEWKRQVESFIKAGSIEVPETVRETWEKEFAKRRKVFFSEVWLRSNAPKQLYKAVTNVIRAYEEIKNSSELETKINKLVKDTEEKIKHEVDDARMLVLLDSILDEKQKNSKDKFDALRRQFSLDDDTVFAQQFSNYFPFERYSFQPLELSDITRAVKGLLEAEGSNNVKRGLLRDYAELINNNQQQTDNLWIRRLTRISVVLKTVEATRVLKYLLNKIDPNLPNFSFKILFAELLFKSKEKYSRAKKILEELTFLYYKEKESEKGNKELQNDLAIGIALLYYWWWENEGGDSLWLTRDKSEIEKLRDLEEQRNLDERIEQAIFFAEEAYKIWEGSGETEKEEIYALNLFVYFQTRSNQPPQRDFINYGTELGDHYINNEEKWSLRYNDTLGLYFAKLAKYAKEKEDCDHFMQLSFKEHDTASEIAEIDETVKKNKQRILKVAANLSKKFPRQLD